jgi:hypothetical protein
MKSANRQMGRRCRSLGDHRDTEFWVDSAAVDELKDFSSLALSLSLSFCVGVVGDSEVSGLVLG